MKCKLCDQEGHKALDCKERRKIDWAGVPKLSAEDAWSALIDAAKDKDLDVFRICLKAYARATMEQFSLPDVETALREDGLGVYLIAKPQEIAANMTIIDLIGTPDCEYVLSVQTSDKPRRAKLAQGWPESPEQNLERLASAGYVEDRGVPLCGNCNEIGHIRKVSTVSGSPFENLLLTYISTVSKSSLNARTTSPRSLASTARRTVIVLATAPRSASTHMLAGTASRRATVPRSAPNLALLKALSAASATRLATSPRM